MNPKKSPPLRLMQDDTFIPQHITQLPYSENKIWLNTAEMSQYFKVSERTINRWRQKQLLPAAKISGTLLFPLSFINHLLLQKAQQQLGTKE